MSSHQPITAREAARDLATRTAIKAHHEGLLANAPAEVSSYGMTLGQFRAYTERL